MRLDSAEWMKPWISSSRPSSSRARNGQPFGEGTHGAGYRSADEVVVGIDLQMNGIGADLRVKDFEVELAERVKRLLADIGDALRQRDRQEEVLAVVDGDGPVVGLQGPEQDARGGDDTARQIDPLRLELQRCPRDAMVAADSDPVGALLHRADDHIRLIAKIARAFELRQGLLGTVDVSVRAAIHAHAAIHAARFLRATGGFDGDAGAAMKDPGFAQAFAVTVHRAQHRLGLAAGFEVPGRSRGRAGTGRRARHVRRTTPVSSRTDL